MDENEKVVVYTYTSNDGEYELRDISAGTYTLLIDKVGYAPYRSLVEIEFEGDVRTVDADLQEFGVTDVDDPAAANLSLRIHPNPAMTAVSVVFPGHNGIARITLFDLRGNTVYETSVEAHEGLNSLRVPTGQLSAGTYLLAVRNAGNVATSHLRVIR